MTTLRFHPTVFSVKDTYQIIFLTEKPGMGWVEIGGQKYLDAQNGLMRWTDEMHRVTVPRAALDEAKEYAVCFQEMEDRKPYYPVHGDTVRRRYAFTPLNADAPVRILYLSDTHGKCDGPVACAKQREFDLLIMGGDIADHNSTKQDLWVLFKICSEAVRGEKPVVFSRGNHDTRGRMAEYLPGMIGTDNGNTYFTFELPGVFGLVLDAGEDKRDSCREYGGTTCFELFRREETAWLESVKNEGRWKDAPVRIAVCHIPFTMRQQPPFDIEQDIYARWSELLNEMGVEYLISGHMHQLHILRPGDEQLWNDAQFITLVGSETPQEFVGAHYTISPDALHLVFAHYSGEIRMKEEILRK
ncbi:MAG: metallophosphoesterase [Clostridia bacterium]|nr:metallophosphoesterase [Clostridia bacterium]